MKAWFLSDQHLVSPQEERSQALLRFFRAIRSVEDAAYLFLMGDVFDLWVGKHRFFIDRWAPFNAELARLRYLGVEVHLFEGNHDLYLSDYFANQLGLHVHREAVIMRLGSASSGKIFRLEHGDQMDPEDRGYKFLRWFLRTPVVEAGIRHIPEAAVVSIGERASHASRDYTSSLKTIDTERAKRVMREHTARVYTDEPFDILVCGHIHVKEDAVIPVNESGDRVRLINLGFQEQPLCLEL